MPEKLSLLPAVSGQTPDVEPGVFTFRVLQVTEAVAFGEGARACISLFGEVFQRTDSAANPRRICSGRVEFQPNERDGGHVGRFSFPAQTEVQPFLLGGVDVRPSAMQHLIETLRSGPGVELAFHADIASNLLDLAQDETSKEDAKRQSFNIRTVSVSVSR